MYKQRPPASRKFTVLPDFDAITRWVGAVIDARLADETLPFRAICEKYPVPRLSPDSALGSFIDQNDVTPEAVFALLFMFEYTRQPPSISRLIGETNPAGLRPIEGFYAPSGYTIAYLIDGRSSDQSSSFDLFRASHPFNRRSILQLASPPPGLGEYAGVVQFVPGIFDMYITNRFQAPRFGDHFPAKLLTTDQSFEDMIHPPYLLEKMKVVTNALEFEHRMRYEMQMDSQLPKGFRVLMSGPPGTGKSMAASIIGSCMNRDVYTVMLSQVLSKYIGESERNLENMFNMAEGKGWVLFFDEADALFGNRAEDGKGDDAGSRNRDQLFSYLLPRVENFNGIIFAATNLESNMDVAFKRRFQERLIFTLPDEALRRQLWEKYLPKNYERDERLTPEWFAQFRLPPSSIANVCNRQTLYSLYYRQNQLRYDEMLLDIKTEMHMLGIN